MSGYNVRAATRLTAFDDPAMAVVEAFAQRVARGIVEPEWPSPPRDMGKLVRIWGAPEIEPLCAGHGFRGAEAAALGVSLATERTPGRFGTVEDFNQWSLDEIDAKAAHAGALAVLETAWAADDVTVAEHGRGTGLVTIMFKGFDFGPVADGWPATLADRAATKLAAAA